MSMIINQSEGHKGPICSNDSYEEVGGKLKDIGVCNQTTICIDSRGSIILNKNTKNT